MLTYNFISQTLASQPSKQATSRKSLRRTISLAFRSLLFTIRTHVSARKACKNIPNFVKNTCLKIWLNNHSQSGKASKAIPDCTSHPKLFRIAPRPKCYRRVYFFVWKSMQKSSIFGQKCMLRNRHSHSGNASKSHTRLHEPSKTFSDSSLTEMLPACVFFRVKRHAKIDHFHSLARRSVGFFLMRRFGI